MCRLAAEKDTGFRPELLHYGLAPFERLPRSRFDIDDAHYADLSSWVRSTYESEAPPQPPTTTWNRSLEL